MADDFLVLPKDAQAAGFCLVPGVRDFALRIGMDFRDFMRNGIPASVLIALGDSLADRTVAKARERLNK